MSDFKCKNKAMALAALDTIAESLKGSPQAAVLAVKDWVQENVGNGLTDEVQKKLEQAFTSETEGNRKGREWWDRGSRKVNDKFIPTEPEDGAEWVCIWNAKHKCWEPPYPPPLVAEKTVTV